MKWLISNNPNSEPSLPYSFKYKSFWISSKTMFKIGKSGVKFFINGYIVPRNSSFQKYSHLQQFEMLEEMYVEDKECFISKIKGIFTIIIIDKDQCKIYNDRHNLSIYFYSINSNHIILSDSLKIFKTKHLLIKDNEEAAVFCLFKHFLPGHTMFKDIKTSLPASLTLLGEKQIFGDQYWTPNDLFKIEKSKMQFSELANEWYNIISNSIDYLKPKEITVTITGGNDSRMIVSALLKKGIPFNGYTYGNPNSRDGYIASILAKKIDKLNYHNYYAESANFTWLHENATEILAIGNSLINIHRSHRFDAFKNEMKNNPNNEMIITGMLGGDYIKAFKEKNNEMLRICTLFEEDPTNFYSMTLMNELNGLYLNMSQLNFKKIINIIEDWGVFNLKNKAKREFFYMYHLWGCTHHSQDSRLFSNKIKYNFNPFMDIDFLELLAKSGRSLLLEGKNNLISKVFSSLFQVKITDMFAPELSNIPYAKEGLYTANEYLRNPVWQIIKRTIGHIRNNNHFPANFPVGDWYKDAIINYELFDDIVIMSIFNKNKIISSYQSKVENKREESWYIFTNPLNLKLNNDYWSK